MSSRNVPVSGPVTKSKEVNDKADDQSKGGEEDPCRDDEKDDRREGNVKRECPCPEPDGGREKPKEYRPGRRDISPRLWRSSCYWCSTPTIK